MKMLMIDFITILKYGMSINEGAGRNLTQEK